MGLVIRTAGAVNHDESNSSLVVKGLNETGVFLCIAAGNLSSEHVFHCENFSVISFCVHFYLINYGYYKDLQL